MESETLVLKVSFCTIKEKAIKLIKNLAQSVDSAYFSLFINTTQSVDSAYFPYLTVLGIKNLPDDSSWDDIIYEIYVKKKIEIGLKAAEEGKTLSHDEVKKRFAR